MNPSPQTRESENEIFFIADDLKRQKTFPGEPIAGDSMLPGPHARCRQLSSSQLTMTLFTVFIFFNISMIKIGTYYAFSGALSSYCWRNG